ncbi:MAG: acetyltransferase [Arcobacter sp.]|nr:MAG: acetyltransferase [Arcobacter sp.]
MQSIYIYGASGHGLVVADIAKACGYNEIIFVDDGDNDYLSFDEIKNNNDIPISFGIGSNRIRKLLYKKLKKYNFEIVSLIHPSSIISSNVIIGNGTVIMPNVVVNSNSVIGKAVILNTSCIIEHENIVENFVHISPNVALAGCVKISESSHLGIGTCVIQGLTIGENCIIGAGSVVVNDIKDNIKAYGNPCKIIEVIE